MRFIRDVLLLVVLIAVGVGIVLYQRDKREEQAAILKTVSETRRLEMEVKFRAATKGAELNTRGWPMTIDPIWFEKDPPFNTLVGDERPWVEIASAAESEMQHPAVRMTLDSQTAAFWYNPYQGVVRARVPVMVSDEGATALYNQINESNLSSIFWIEVPPPRGQPAQTSKDDSASSAVAQAGPRSYAPEPPRVVVRRTPPKPTGKPKGK